MTDVLDLSDKYIVMTFKVVVDPKEFTCSESADWLREALEMLNLIGGVSFESLQAIPVKAGKEAIES